MATTHDNHATEHSSGHPSTMQYVIIAILLFAITIVEFVIIWDRAGIADSLSKPVITIVLFLLSGIKFAIVILFYMHLKFDNKLFFWVFVAGLVLALSVGLSLIGLFTAIKGEPRAYAEVLACPYDHEEGTICEDDEALPTSTPPPPITPIAVSTPDPSVSGEPSGGGEPSATKGEGLATTYGCVACHSPSGDVLVGPSWKGIYGSQEALADGSSATVDDDYIRESINEPNARVVEGFTPGLMPVLGVKPEEIDSIIEYIKTLN